MSLGKYAQCRHCGNIVGFLASIVEPKLASRIIVSWQAQNLLIKEIKTPSWPQVNPCSCPSKRSQKQDLGEVS